VPLTTYADNVRENFLFNRFFVASNPRELKIPCGG